MSDTTRTATTSPERIEALDEADCLTLIAPGGIGRIAYAGRYGQTVLPVNYQLLDNTIVFRTGEDSPLEQDLQTGIRHAEWQVAFEIDEIDLAAKGGWSVLIQGHAHHVDSDTEREAVRKTGVQPWSGGAKEHYIRVVPTRITGRRVHSAR
jgi:nitroimidazol reductase NimA-like FMN-containing flavoprotein (pyridoxamine 5'-phosphate oxidase superfamily)